MTTQSRSAALYERACKILPGGVSRNTVLRDPHPLYAVSGNGCRVIDIEGVERIDFANNMASLIHGHAHPEIVEAVTEQLARGSAFTLATEIEVRYAEHLCGRNPAFERLRFVNSGTEAVMAAIKASRAYTGRSKIAKIEGAYHGQYDYAEVSQMPNPGVWGAPDRPASVPSAYGTPVSALGEVVVMPFNNIERSLRLLEENRGKLACLLLDLMPHRVGLRPADPTYVATLAEWARNDGALIALDEVITFRCRVGGAQTWYDLTPDLTALGKMIGGGFPVGAIAGRAEVMAVMDPHTKPVLFPHSGTFSANPVTMTAGLAAMERFDDAEIARLNALCQRAMEGITAAAARTGLQACVTGGGSILRVHLKEHPPTNYREAYWEEADVERMKVLLDHLFDSGLMMINTCSVTLSTPMGEEEIDALVAAMEEGFEILVERFGPGPGSA